MRIEQAIYGEVRNGHGLRGTSGDLTFARDLAPRLDLPDTAPPGVSWSPYVSGFAFQGRYVIARTFLDESAPRAGMVFTHALIAALDEICELGSISTLFNHLMSSQQATTELLGFELKNRCEPPAHALDLVGAANALVKEGSGPVVRIGVEGFGELVACLWPNLWPAARRSFSFRLSFGPTDLGAEGQAPTIVCTPSQLRAPWARFRVLAPDDSVPSSAAAALLAGERDAAALHKFALDFGIKLQRIADLSIAERAMELISKAQTFEELLAAARVIGVLSPSAEEGVERKSALLGRLVAKVSDTTVEQLFLTRNLSDSAFDGAGALWRGIERRLSGRSFSADHDQIEIQMLAAAADRNLARASWQTAAKSAFINTTRRSNAGFAAAVWRWTQQDPLNFMRALELLPSDRAIATSLAATAPPKLSLASPSPLLNALAAKGWLDVHGALLSATATPTEAIRQQLKVDRDGAYMDGLRCAFRVAKPSQIVECALEFDDERLIAIAVETATQSPAVLRHLDFDSVPAQRIWGGALARDQSLWSAPANPAGARDAILLRLLKSQPFDAGLLLALARSPLSDLSESPTRPQVWAALSRVSETLFLSATGRVWLDSAILTSTWTVPEAPLQAWLLDSTELDSRLSASTTSPATALSIISALSDFDEGRFLVWIHRVLSTHPRLSSVESDLLGRFMLARNWSQSVGELADRYLTRRPDLRPALVACAPLLSWVKRWIHNIRPLSADEKWRAFIDEAARLYPSGPDHAELWSRADGTNADLPTGYSGRARWHSIGVDLRNGRRPTTHQLLAEMQLDFPQNEELRLFASDPDIVGRTR